MTDPRVVLHIGAPKSGTTFLQRSLWARRPELAGVGVRPVGERARDMFEAAIGIRGSEKFWRRDPDELRALWERLCEQARSGPGTWVMSHEILAASSRERAERALADLAGTEVHVVFTARDLGRQVPSEWQERIKNGGTVSFGDFQDKLRTRITKGTVDSSFWRFQDLIDVLDRWAVSLPPQRVHVVTAPASGAAPEVLWQRFAEAVGFDGEAIAPEVGARSNQTLGIVQAELLRRLNEALDGRIPQPHYARLVKRQFSQNTLTHQSSPRPRCSPGLLEDLRGLAEAHNAEVRARGYVVHGDLDELVPSRGDDAPETPELGAEAMAAAATTALADLLAARVPKPDDRHSQGRRAAPGAGARGDRGRVRMAAGLARRLGIRSGR